MAIICHRRGINAKLPPVWLIYLPVDDLRESLLEVEKEGGAVVQTATVNSGTDQYQYAVIQDPVGVYVALLQD